MEELRNEMAEVKAVILQRKEYMAEEKRKKAAIEALNQGATGPDEVTTSATSRRASMV